MFSNIYNPVMQSSEQFLSLSNIRLWLKHWKLFFILDPRALWAFRILVSRKRPRNTGLCHHVTQRQEDGIYLLLSYCSGPSPSFNNHFCWKLLYYFSLSLDSFLILPIKALKKDYMSYSVRNASAQALHPKAAVGGSYRSQKQQQPPDSSSLEALICSIPSFLLSYTYGKETSCNCYLCYFSYFCFSCLLTLLEPIPVSNFHDWRVGMGCFVDRILIDPPGLHGIKVHKILITLENRLTHIQTNEKYKKILTSSPLKYMQVVKYIQVVCLKKHKESNYHGRKHQNSET